MAKTIVITGGGSGLGKALAKRFAGDGDKVVVLGRTQSKIEGVAQEAGGGVIALACDVSDPNSVRSVFADIAARAGSIDVLINNAAIYEPYTIDNATDDKVIQTLMINTAGPIFCTREAVARMNRGGQIINVTSESVEANFPMLSIYQTSKAALERFSRSMNEELRPRGISVTYVRAGAMYDENLALSGDPEVLQQFGAEMVKRGINPRETGVTHFNSVTHMFRALVDLPPDMQTPGIHLGARLPQA